MNSTEGNTLTIITAPCEFLLNFVNYRKAFGSVPHETLVQKLDPPGVAMAYLHSWLYYIAMPGRVIRSQADSLTSSSLLLM